MGLESLLELVKLTVTEVDNMLRLSDMEFARNYGCEPGNARNSKLDRAATMISMLKLFIDQFNDLSENSEKYENTGKTALME